MANLKNKRRIKMLKAFKGAEADARERGKAMSPGTDASGNPRGDNNPYTGGSTTKKVSTPPKSTGETKTFVQNLTTPTPFMTLNLLKNYVTDPIKKKQRTKKAQGEKGLFRPIALPATKDYYKMTGEPLDVMSKKGEAYLKEAGLIGSVKSRTPDKNGPTRCADGTLPPCKPVASSSGAPSSINKKSNISFLRDMTFYPANLKSGGVSFGPPPKSGPNSQVPPVKMKNGKMTKKYKMSCPHRPDGIRGVGAAIKGHKFIGVK